VDAELDAERARAAERRKEQEDAIEAKKAELQALHDSRKQEVRFCSTIVARLLNVVLVFGVAKQ
jgi:hypothetical protein